MKKILFLLLLPMAAIAQNEDSLDAYVRDFMKPEISLSIVYNSDNFDLTYEKQTPLSLATEEFIKEQKEQYEKTKNPSCLMIIGQTYKRMNMRTIGRTWMEQAEKEVEAAIATYPDSSKLHETSMLIYMELERYEKFTKAAQEIVRLHPDSESSIFSEAMTYMFNDVRTGLEKSRKGIEKYPGHVKWYVAQLLFEIRYQVHQYGFGTEEAKNHPIDPIFLLDAKKSYPDSTKIEFAAEVGQFFIFAYQELLPEIYSDVPDFDEIEGFQFAFSPEIQKKLDVFQLQMEAFLKRKEFKNWHTLHYTLGSIYLLQSDYSKAQKFLEQAIKLKKPEYRSSQDNVYAYYDNLIACCHLLGDLKSAEKWSKVRATSEVNMDPSAQHYTNLALYHIQRNDMEKGKELLESAITMDSLTIDAYTYMALILMLDDQMEEAGEYLSQAQSINMDDLTAFKATILFSLYMKSTSTAKDLVDMILAYDETDPFALDMLERFIPKE